MFKLFFKLTKYFALTFNQQSRAFDYSTELLSIISSQHHDDLCVFIIRDLRSQQDSQFDKFKE